MSLKTRLDGRSKDNNLVQIKNDLGVVLATIKVDGKQSTTLEIDTPSRLYLEKPNGWVSKTTGS